MRTEPERVGTYDVYPAFAHGGMATVHVGRHRGAEGFTKLVAVKRQHRALESVGGAAEAQGRALLDEARLSSRIRSPFVVPVIDVINDEGRLSIVMELVHGVTLATLLECAETSGTPVPFPVVAAIVSDVARGLHAAHEATDEAGRSLELVHRDVSPQNILVGLDGVSRIVDFGIARAFGRERVTSTGEVRGKIGYIAPEQLRPPEPITRSADIYAAGVVLWEALSLQAMRKVSDVAAILGAASVEPIPPSARRPEVPVDFDDVAVRAIRPVPRERFANAEAMAIAIEEACAPASRAVVGDFVEHVAATPLALLADAMRVAERGPAEAPASAPLDRSSRRRRVALGAAITLGVVLLAGVVVVTATSAGSSHEGGSPRTPAMSSSMSPSSTPAVETASASGVTSAPSSAPSAVAPHPTRPQGGAATTRRASPRGAHDCNPPYTFDDAGRKHYLPHCIP